MKITATRSKHNKKLSNNLALYFKGTNSYSPRIYPAKIASDQRNDFYFDGSKEFRTKEELKTSTQVFDAKVTGLGGTAYRYSFEVSSSGRRRLRRWDWGN